MAESKERRGISRRGFLGTLGVAGSTLALAGCSSTSTGQSSTSSSQASSPSSDSLVAITSQHVQGAVADIDSLARHLLVETGLPGMAVAVVHNDQVVYAKGFGVRKVGTSEKVGTDTVFELASVSKSVAATVVARLVGEKVVAWDDPVTKYLPNFALADPYVTQHVTIADMFSHRSGLPDHAGDLIEDLGYDQATILQRLRYYPLDSFRDSYAYTNFGLTAAAVAAATAAGTDWADLSQRQLYGPLGMSSTSSRYADFAAAPNHATLHARIDGKWVAKYTRDADAQSPAGGVSSSVQDMARWMRLQLGAGRFQGQQLVNAEALLTAHTPQVVSMPPSKPTDRPSFYGLGANVGIDDTGRVRFSHSGGFASGAATAYLLLPSANLGIVALTNGMPIGVPEALTLSFADLVVSGKVQRDWYEFLYKVAFAPMYVNHSELAGKQPPQNPTPALPAPAYTGTYTNDLFGPGQITVTPQGGLILSLGPAPMTFALSHWDGNTFSYLPPGEDAVGISAVTFAVGAGGQATSVSIENLNGGSPEMSDLGNFVRA